MLGVPETINIRVLSRTTLMDTSTWLLPSRFSPTCRGTVTERCFRPTVSGINASETVVSAGEPPGSLDLLVLYVPGDTAHPPCGACRQVMRELMSGHSRVVSCCDTDATRRWTAEDYLPDPFTPESLTR